MELRIEAGLVVSSSDGASLEVDALLLASGAPFVNVRENLRLRLGISLAGGGSGWSEGSSVELGGSGESRLFIMDDFGTSVIPEHWTKQIRQFREGKIDDFETKKAFELTLVVVLFFICIYLIDSMPLEHENHL